jgi:hypothetical protein
MQALLFGYTEAELEEAYRLAGSCDKVVINNNNNNSSSDVLPLPDPSADHKAQRQKAEETEKKKQTDRAADVMAARAKFIIAWRSMPMEERPQLHIDGACGRECAKENPQLHPHGICGRDCTCYEHVGTDIWVCFVSGNIHFCNREDCEHTRRFSEGMICDISGVIYPLEFEVGGDDETGDKGAGMKFERKRRDKNHKQRVTKAFADLRAKGGGNDDEPRRRQHKKQKKPEMDDDDGDGGDDDDDDELAVMSPRKKKQTLTSEAKEKKLLEGLGFLRPEGGGEVKRQKQTRKNANANAKRAKGEGKKSHHSRRSWKDEDMLGGAMAILYELLPSSTHVSQASVIESVANVCKATWKIAVNSTHHKKPKRGFSYRYGTHCFVVAWCTAGTGLSIDIPGHGKATVVHPSTFMTYHMPDGRNPEKYDMTHDSLTQGEKYFARCMQTAVIGDLRAYVRTLRPFSE